MVLSKLPEAGEEGEGQPSTVGAKLPTAVGSSARARGARGSG